MFTLLLLAATSQGVIDLKDPILTLSFIVIFVVWDGMLVGSVCTRIRGR